MFSIFSGSQGVARPRIICNKRKAMARPKGVL